MILRVFAFATALLLAVSTAQAIDSGATPPDFNLPAMQNAKAKTLSLDAYKGKVVYVDFWASWCGPCRTSLPILNEFREKYKEKGFEVIAINVDENPEDAKDFLKKYPVSYPIASDPAATTAELYNISGMPTAFIIGKNGKVLYKHEGFKKKQSKELEMKIRNFLSE